MKRTIDIVIAAVSLLFLSPLLLAIAIGVRLTSRGPVLYRQLRVGRHGRPFVMLKFRSMYESADDSLHREYVTTLLTDGGNESPHARSFKLYGDPRITRVGRVLRRFSLDELPQLFNVVRGEMSLVGPRPALPYEVELYQPHHRCRLDVQPGLTGLWQVSGRNRLSMLEMLDIDARYVRTRTAAMDLKILAKTIPVLLRSDGAR